MTPRDLAVQTIAEAIYEWEMARDGWEEIKSFSRLNEDVRNDYLEISEKITDLYEYIMEDDEFDEEELDWIEDF